MAQTVSKVCSYLILLLNINFNSMLNFGYTQTLFSNFLSFNFGLLISSLYVLLILLDSRIETQEKPSFLIGITIFWVLVVDAAISGVRTIS